MGKFGNKGKGPSQRQLRVGEIVRHALIELLQRGDIEDALVKDSVISVSEVSMSPDLKIATAFIAPLGRDDAQEISDALNNHAKFIRGRLTPTLRQMKYMPNIRFRPDTGFDNYSKIDALLHSPAVARDLQNDDDGGQNQ